MDDCITAIAIVPGSIPALSGIVDLRGGGCNYINVPVVCMARAGRNDFDAGTSISRAIVTGGPKRVESLLAF